MESANGGGGTYAGHDTGQRRRGWMGAKAAAGNAGRVTVIHIAYDTGDSAFVLCFRHSKKAAAVAMQEEESACAHLPDTFPISLCSGILILMSLQFFFRLSRENAAAAAGERNGRPEQAGEAASFLVLLAAVIRFAVLICSRTALESGEAAELFEEAAMG